MLNRLSRSWLVFRSKNVSQSWALKPRFLAFAGIQGLETLESSLSAFMLLLSSLLHQSR